MKKITKKRKLHRLIAWLLAIAMLSGYVPQGVSLKGLDVFKNMGKVQAANYTSESKNRKRFLHGRRSESNMGLCVVRKLSAE